MMSNAITQGAHQRGDVGISINIDGTYNGTLPRGEAKDVELVSAYRDRGKTAEKRRVEW